MKKISGKLTLMGLLVVSILGLRGRRVFATGFKSNFASIKENVTPEKEAKFISCDKEYLSENPGKEKLNNEIKDLEKELIEVKKDYFKTNNNIKIYTGNACLKNNALRTAIVNRRGLIKSGENFRYDDRSRYIIGRDFVKETKVRRLYSQKQLDDSLRFIKEVVENLEINTSFLKNTSFTISPYLIDGINGYTMTQSGGDSLIVISGQDLLAPDDFIERSIKSTVLHEIGHVFLNNKHVDLKKYKVNIEIDPTIRADNLDRWEKSEKENFAEDFRIYASGKLGSKSFKPMKKKTTIKTDRAKFAEIMARLCY